MKSLFLKKLLKPRIWGRIFRERLTEPLHLNLLALLVWLFGSFRQKVAFDLVVRQHIAYSVLRMADQAKQRGLSTVSLIEFGVASGAGLMNMAKIAERATRATGVSMNIYGFDTGKGMPAPQGYKDHPDLYTTADFPMDFERLRASLPTRVNLIIGEVSETLPQFLQKLPSTEPIAFVVFDVDYYSSTTDALKILLSDPLKYLPVTLTYFDDVRDERHNSWCGALLAIGEFNAQHAMRKVERYSFISDTRIFKRASWLKQIYQLHVLDHPDRQQSSTSKTRVLKNPYL